VDIVQAGPSHREQWDAWVEAHPEASPYYLFAWREAVEGVYAHWGRYLMALDGGGVRGVLPLVRMTGLLGGDALVSLPFCDGGGPLAECASVAQELRRAALAAARHEGVGVVELRESAPEEAPVREGGEVRMVLRLPGSREALWGALPSGLRSQVTRAEENGLSFRWGSGGDVALSYRVFSRNMRDLGRPVHSLAWLQAVVRGFGTKCRLGLVSLGDEPVACGLVLATGRRASLCWVSTLGVANPLGPEALLHWELVAGAAEEGVETFDFGRTRRGQGTHGFEEQCGARPRALRWQKALVGRDWQDLCPATSRGREVASAAWSRLPLGIANALGPALRRYISL
jgi:FemAB-related protein (PEP-CTERM system-associated)